ncbi:Chaperone protein TorD [Nymphon striatum]|nr:Chaperone protein TorD [Nymphon striatum]
MILLSAPESAMLKEELVEVPKEMVANLEALESLGGEGQALTSEIIQFEGSSPNSPVGEQITINGALGQFEVSVGGKEFKSDLILDLSPKPILDMAYKPPGYISTGTERVDIKKLKGELEELIGVFEKPLYINYDENICAHGRSGKKGCTRCIDACPAEAISSLLDKVKVDTSRCHGGGICATEEEQERAGHILPAALVITVEEVASVGVEVWLSALAWGASSVYIFTLDGIPDTARQALELHLKMAQKILGAMNYPANVVSVLNDSSELITGSSNALQDGREMPQVSLIEEKCLQCNVCVNTCPENAISITPRLLFDRELRMKAKVLHQDEPFCCTKCGKPFATTSGIANIMTKLAGHSMFADERSRSPVFLSALVVTFLSVLTGTFCTLGHVEVARSLHYKLNNKEIMSEGKMFQQTQSQQFDDNLQQTASMNASMEAKDASMQSEDMSIQAEQQYRASAYSILAALLRGVPAQEVLDHVSEFANVNNVDEDELLLSMSSLGLAAQSSDVSAIDDEYHVLFIGLGKGELVPYGSWYLTGFLMEQPLSILRDDLKALGYERDESVVEPEDHVAALCEIMALLITESAGKDQKENLGKDETQVIFFEKHIEPWIGKFFKDLSEAESAVFYRAVGRFGTAFINFEKLYLDV